jgi:LysM repeat protein
MTRHVPSILAFAGIVLAAGCVSLSDWEKQSLLDQSEMEGLQVRVRRLEERVVTLQSANQSLYREMDALRASSAAGDRDLRTQVAEVVKTLKASEGAIEKVRQETVKALSDKIAEVIRAQEVVPPKVEKGREHVVQRGETLTRIAAAYQADVAEILRANKLQDAHSLRVGQKLFIPSTPE